MIYIALANTKRYRLFSSVRSSFTTACHVLRSASFSLEISVVFCPGKPVAALGSLALMKGFLWASATKAASWAGLDTRYNPVPLRLPTCPSLRYFCCHALAVDLRTPYSSPAELALIPPTSARAMTCSRIDLSWWAIVIRMNEGRAWTLSQPCRCVGSRTILLLTNPFHFISLFGHRSATSHY